MRTVIHRTARLLGDLALLAGILLTLSAPARAQVVSFSGTWKTIAGGTHQYTVILKQIGKNVTGSYSPGNGKIFDGVVTDNKLTFKWTQDGGYEGTAEFRMSDDGKGFNGFSKALKPEEFIVPWTTYEAESASFAGNWETIADGQNSLLLTIVQTGNKVTGVYPSSNGKLEGTVSGKVLRFKWESDIGSGSGRFVMDDSNTAFSGTYNRGDNPDKVETSWSGTRQSGEGGNIPPVSVAGVWNAFTSDGEAVTLTLQQAGNQVTGKLKSRSIDVTVDLKKVTLVGNTLRFIGVVDGKQSTIGVLVRDADGKSLKGKINENSITFILQTGSEAPERVTPPPISFNGVWNALRGTTSMTFRLLQTGDQVTGQFEGDVAGSTITTLSEGIVIGGNTLRFKFKLAPSDRSARGSGELVLAEDGKSFKGHIAGIPTTGTFFQPQN